MNTNLESNISLEQAKHIAAHSPVGVQFYDAEGFCIFVNEAFVNIFGGAPPPGYCVLKDELVAAAGSLGLIHQAFSGTPTKLPLLWYDARDLQNLSESDLEYTRKSGKKCAIETTMIPVLGANKEVAHVVFIYKDITGELFMQEERERALKERDDTKVMFQSVLDQTQAVIYIKDVNGKFIFANGQFCRIFNMKLEHILGKKDHDIFPKDVADRYRENDIQVLAKNSHLEVEETAIHSDQTTHTYISLKFPLHDSNRSLLGICGISTDITARRKLENELNVAKRMEAVGLLAGGIAHNFNNILGIILLVSDTLLLKSDEQNLESQTAIQSIKASAQSASLLTRQLLAFGKQRNFHPSILDLGTIISGMKEILKSALGADIHFKTEIEQDTWPIQADPLQIEQILANLSLNARDAMPKGGSFTISVRNVNHQGEFVEVIISDTGAGIPPDVQRQIFEPFFTTKKNGQSTGLGLATVQEIVQKTGGKIEVDSMLGKGSTFRILFPKAVGSLLSNPINTTPSSTSYSGKETILIVEDDGTLRNVTAKLLREFGYTVIEAKDGSTALELWKTISGKVDLVMTDIILPGISGVELVHKMSLHAFQQPLNVLFVSGYSERKLSEHNFDRDRSHFIEKPYSAHLLFSKIREALKDQNP